MIATLPPLPPRPYSAGAIGAWLLEALRCGYVQTGNGYFAFWAFTIAHDAAAVDVEGTARVEVPPWVTRALLEAADKLSRAEGALEVAGALGMRGAKGEARDARHAHGWFDNAMHAALVRDAIATKGANQGEALAAVAGFLTSEGVAMSADALRKRIERLRPPPVATSFPSDPFGRTGKK